MLSHPRPEFDCRAARDIGTHLSVHLCFEPTIDDHKTSAMATNAENTSCKCNLQLIVVLILSVRCGMVGVKSAVEYSYRLASGGDPEAAK